MAEGRIVRGPYYFYSNTYALEVEHELQNGQTLLVRYGEIYQNVPAGIKVGASVEQGQHIANVGRLKSGNSMLHLEMYRKGSDHGKLTVVGQNKHKRRADVMNPTGLLDKAPTLEEVSTLKAAPTTQEPPTTPAPRRSYPGVVARQVPDRLNIREAPNLMPRTAVRFQLKPGDSVDVLEPISGGRYPYGQGNLWFKLRQGDKEGYAVAYFIDTNYPLQGPSGLDGAAEFGYVSGLDTDLNIRAAASTDAPVLYLLTKGRKVQVRAQLTGGGYGSNRNDWLQIRPAEPENETEKQTGYAAALYVDIGQPDRSRGASASANLRNQAATGNLNRWERILLNTDWPGCSSKTARAHLGGSFAAGAAASKEIARRQVADVKHLAGIFHDVAAKFGMPAALLAGIASRESNLGKALDSSGWGDHGNGFGIMQVDRNAHRILGSDPAGQDHIEQAAGIFADNLERMTAGPKFQGWEDRFLLLGATAAYNFGIGNVRNQDRIDEGTSGNDYGADTLARARYFHEHPELYELRG